MVKYIKDIGTESKVRNRLLAETESFQLPTQFEYLSTQFPFSVLWLPVAGLLYAQILGFKLKCKNVWDVQSVGASAVF